jgi:hypothetical protein
MNIIIFHKGSVNNIKNKYSIDGFLQLTDGYNLQGSKF